MQSGPLPLRSKALSVFRACIEQMEMYKDTSAYKDAVRSYIDSSLQPWIEALDRNLAEDLTSLKEEEYDAGVKLTYATYKVRSCSIALLLCCFGGCLWGWGLMVDGGVVGEGVSGCFTQVFASVVGHRIPFPGESLSILLTITVFLESSFSTIIPIYHLPLRDPSNYPAWTVLQR